MFVGAIFSRSCLKRFVCSFKTKHIAVLFELSNISKYLVWEKNHFQSVATLNSLNVLCLKAFS